MNIHHRRALLALLVAAVVAIPVAANGPGPDSGYRYEATNVTDATGEAARQLAAHPQVVGGLGEAEAWRVTRNATNATYRHPVDDLHADVRRLTDATAVVGPFGREVYVVDARVENGTFLLDTRRLPSVEAAARRVAVPPSEVAPSLRRAVRGERVTGQQRYEAVVVRTADGPVLVRSVPASVPDPFRWPKLAGSALAVGLVVFAGIENRRG